MVLSTSWLLQYIKSLLGLHYPSVEPGALLFENLWGDRWGKGKEEESGTRLSLSSYHGHPRSRADEGSVKGLQQRAGV